MAWPFFSKKSVALPPPAKSPEWKDDEDFQAWCRQANSDAAALTEKNFDWMHYQSITQGNFNSMFAGEFNIIPATRILKGMFIQEPWVNYCVSAIVRQFLTSRFQLGQARGKDGQLKLVKKHPLLDYLRLAGNDLENQAFFVANSICDLVLTGNAYWWTSKDLKIKRRIPAERMEPIIKENKVVKYRLLDRNELGFANPNGMMEFQPEEITHIKLFNPYTPHIGLSMLIATTMPVLIDKYGLEYVVGFFLRGGNSSGIIETNTTNMEQLLKLARTIMQAFGGRKNMHADKILPQGAKWQGSGNTFAQLGMIDLLKQNIGMFRAATGCTNTVLGIAENVNYATAKAEMELFYKSTILPLQKLFCMGVEASDIWERFGLDETWELCFDNSGVEALDDFDRRLEQDKVLKDSWTVNERRERLGKDPIEGYDVLEMQLKPAPVAGLPAPTTKKKNLADAHRDFLTGWKAAELELQDPNKAIRDLFHKEFAAWEKIVLDNLKSQKSATKEIQARAGEFAKAFNKKSLPAAMMAYDSQRLHLQSSRKSFYDVRLKESEEDKQRKLDLLRKRAEEVIAGNILDGAETRFAGYSDTMMERIYKIIDNGLEQNQSLTDIASTVRTEFSQFLENGEEYTGQAETIIQTEFSSAISVGQAQFGEDLASVSKKLAKHWVSMGDHHVRQSHVDAEKSSPIEGPSDEVIDTPFANGLRYPRDPEGSAEEIVRCRCTIRYSVSEW